MDAEENKMKQALEIATDALTAVVIQRVGYEKGTTPEAMIALPALARIKTLLEENNDEQKRT